MDFHDEYLSRRLSEAVNDSMRAERELCERLDGYDGYEADWFFRDEFAARDRAATELVKAIRAIVRAEINRAAEGR